MKPKTVTNKNTSVWSLLIAIVFFGFALSACDSKKEIVSLFPIEKYDQTISNWIKASDPSYEKPVLTVERQQKHFAIFYKHYFGADSPWDPIYVNKILMHEAPDDLKSSELELVTNFSNKNKEAQEIGYGENFHPYQQKWIDEISENMNLDQLAHPVYQPANRGIAVDNFRARILPTEDVDFFSHTIAGQGYPFDNLQISALWAGTPLYILGESKDHAWFLILTPDFIAWVKSSGIARTTDAFVMQWQAAAQKNLAAIIKTKTPVIDENNKFRFSAYVGSVFPAEETAQGIKLLIPLSDINQNAYVSTSLVAHDSAVIMPLSPTPHHFADVMSTLIGRPYGWGNMYFYNDCSAELKNLYAAFGIWLPRHSSEQIYAGRAKDISVGTPKQRLNYLMKEGKNFTTIIYIGGHIILYVGQYTNPVTHKPMAMSYQNMWGLHPKSYSGRAVVGRAVLFPLLTKYPENKDLDTQANKELFQVSYLDETPFNEKRIEIIDLKSLMSA